MKQRIAALLALTFMGLALTACGNNAGTTGEAAAEGTASQEAGAETTEPETAGNAEKETSEGTDSGALQDYLTPEGFLDLAKLQEINPDIYAWIDIEGTGLSFPLLQSAEDESFYLSHNERKEADDGGCIYTEYFNRKDFSDPNTVIYGRNVKGRFAGLHQYQDRDFFDSHRTIKIYLTDRVLEYRIFAAYTYDDRHLIKIYDFWDKDIFSAYLKDVFSQRAMDAYVDDSMDVTADDKIITLSTGVTGEDDKRYLVQAVLVSE
ncbi:MAG TPA: class B sortase [Candidatus Eisenbergiella merdipullorum]|uniref:Class B sortase n=1 Tax=Candidatus Eisenbergiella merdipullorum TaxID=2838553 RepID=A0A9D2KZU8_9FIRM|nr:class B sortase [Candidatus Eisenbergiella merdipullorum]